MRCIYCDNALGPEHPASKDHCLPAVLAEFPSQPKFDRICRRCNSEIGKIEEIVARVTPVGKCLHELGVAGRRGIPRQSMRSAHGHKAPEASVFRGGLRVPLDLPSSSQSFNEVRDTIVVKFKDDLPPKQLVLRGPLNQQARRRIADFVSSCDKIGIRQVAISVTECDFDEVQRIVESHISGETSSEVVGAIEPAMHRGVPIRYSFNIPQAKYAAFFLKIAFHHYLHDSLRGHSGQEDCFREVRAAVRHGRPSQGCFGQLEQGPPRHFIDEVFAPNRRSVYRHTVVIDAGSARLNCRVILFETPTAMAMSHRFRLSTVELPSLSRPSLLAGWRYVETRSGRPTRAIERMEESDCSRCLYGLA